MMKTRILPLLLALLLAGCGKNNTITLNNEQISVELSQNKAGLPYIKQAQWKNNDTIIFSGNAANITLHDRLPASILTDSIDNNGDISWSLRQDSISTKAQATRTLHDLVVTWNYRLIRNSSVLKTWIAFKNTGSKKKIPWYPIWQGSLDFGTRENALKYWDALEYTPHKKPLTGDSSYTLQSRVYSSDPKHGPAQLPYWRINNNHHSIYFGISWSGGWESHINTNGSSTQFNVKLPSHETQLALKKGEKIAGPELIFTMVQNPEKITPRTKYFEQKQHYSQMLYDMPASRFPLVYNHWYATRFNLSGNFITDQVKALQDYNFNVFVIDAGWYESVGNWSPAREKFEPGEFEKALKSVKDDEIDVGIWTSPWLIDPEKVTLPPGIDTTNFYREFMESYAIDMAAGNYTDYLLEHIHHLKSDYFMDWWKYDQEFMGINKGAGNIKNIIALQNALKSVRQNNPNLYIENCMSGGRMINDFTNTIAQIHWIKDGGHNGVSHARENIKTALGASEILSLSKVERWTNRVNEIKDPELLKYYCRSAMTGVWGISADMHKITPAQKNIILKEIDHYRKINELKSDNIYQIIHPGNGPLAAITYYNASGNEAWILAFRWKQQGEINQNVITGMLEDDNNYSVQKVNTSQSNKYKGTELKKDGIPVTLEKNSLSAIYHIKAL